jgi:hypothetical protein
MKKLIAVFILLLSFQSSLYAQDTISKDNKWFTEFLIANSSGFTLNLFNGTDLAIGRRIFKNTDLRIVGGFSANSNDSRGNIINNSYLLENSSETSYHRYSSGLDILYRIRIVTGLTFKIGLGYEYVYSVNDHSSNIKRVDEINDLTFRYKIYSNNFKTIGSFHYNFTGNIYVFIQGQLIYIRSHETALSIDNSIYGGKTYHSSSSNDYKTNSFQLDNFFLGGGVSF